MTTCIRRPHARWTTCRCEACTIEQRRLRKAAWVGLVDRPSSDDAVARITDWLSQGYSTAWIASACGVPWGYVQALAADLRAGRGQNIGPNRARAILDADIRTGTTGHAPAIGATRRVRALLALGHGAVDIARTAGISQQMVSYLAAGKVERLSRRQLDGVAHAYAELSMRVGGSVRSRRRAAAGGWAPPLAWDDDAIDDPAATPYTPSPRSSIRTYAETCAEVEHLLAADPLATARHLADRLGYADVTGVQNALERAGRRDLAARLARNAEVTGANVTRRRTA